MPIDEVFPNPTVALVAFEARFPSLFFLEDKIGELQIGLMERYPQSRLLMQKKLLLAKLGPDADIEDLREASEGIDIKTWEFTSEHNVKVHISIDKIILKSRHHKTYKNKASDVRFRDEIQFVTDKFKEIIPLPKFTRVGLRYIDECPVPPSRSTVEFQEYYNSGFPHSRFDLAETDEMQLIVTANRGNHKLRYAEKLDVSDDPMKLILDFDGFAVNVKSEDLIDVADELYQITSEEYEKSINAPLIQWMREKPEQ